MCKMSNFLKSLQLVSMNHKKRNRHLFHRTDVDDDFNFKYIPVQHFKNMVNAVQRKKIKDQEEYLWTFFVHRQWNNYSNKEQKTIKLRDSEITYHDSRINPNVEMSPDRSIELYDNYTEVIKEKVQMFQEHTTFEQDKQWHSCSTSSDNDNFITHRTTNHLSLKIPDKGILFSNGEEISKSKEFCSSNRKENRKYNNEAIIRTTNQFARFPSQDLNILYNNNDPEMIYTRPNPQATYKILTMLRKIGGILDEISLRLDNIPLPDSDHDLQRRQQRATEFSTRFSRNYLYNLGRCVVDLQRHIDAIYSSTKIYLNRRSFAAHMRATEQKLVIAHQLLMHALAFYSKNIPSSVLKTHPGKLKDILQIVTALQDICDKMQLNLCYFGVGDTATSFLGKEIHKKCDSILATMQLSSDYEPQVVRNVHSDIASYKKRRSHRNASNRYSMYMEDSASTRNRNKKLGDIHRGNKRIIVHAVLNDSSLEHSYHGSLTNGSRKQVALNGTIINEGQPREEDIETMMDVLPVNPDENNCAEYRNKCYTSECIEERVKPVSKNVHGATLVHDADNLNKSPTAISDISAKAKQTFATTDEQLPNLVPVIADLMRLIKHKNDLEVRPISPLSTSRMLELLYAYENPTERKPRLFTNTTSNVPRIQESNFNVIAHGSKDMQLSCVPCKECSAHVPHCCDVSCETNHESSEKRSDNLDLTGEDGVKLTLSNDTKFCIVQYRNEYQRVSEFNPMYTSNTQNKPWEIVSWISDKLVDELIIDIAQELEMDGVIQKLFDFEFQEF